MDGVEHILDVLDASADAFVFPILDNGYVYLAASRLTLHRSLEDLAIVFEVFGYSPRAGLPDLNVTAIGSTIIRSRTESDFITSDAYQAHRNANPNWDSSFFYPIQEGGWLDDANCDHIDAAANGFHLRGRVMPMPDRAAYAEAGIAAVGPVQIADFARTVAHSHRDEILATDAEQRANLPKMLQTLLVLNEWHHPDLVNNEQPSASPCFRQLAQVLATGDIGFYIPRPGNTHWRNWPEGGTL